MSSASDSREEREQEEGAEPKFRVIDRRRFAPDGTERDTDTPADAAVAQETVQAAPAIAGDQVGGPGVPIGDAYAAQESGRVLGEASFSALVLSLSTQALVLLGEIADPGTGQAERDLAGARHMIDLLTVLEKKTAGNLDTDELKLLQRILYDLRLRFVELTRS